MTPEHTQPNPTILNLHWPKTAIFLTKSYLNSPLALSKNEKLWLFSSKYLSLSKNLKFKWHWSIPSQTQPFSISIGPKWQFSYQNPILISPWPYLKMKNFDFFLQNFLVGLKIFNLNDAGAYPAKPNHSQCSMPQNRTISIKILS